MDIEATYAEMKSIMHRVLNTVDVDDGSTVDPDLYRMAELFEALDRHIIWTGWLPEKWQEV